MRVTRKCPAAGVMDGMIYFLGGCVADRRSRSAVWAEVFDPILNRWDSVASPAEIKKWIHASAVLDGKFYAMANQGGMVFDPRSVACGRAWVVEEVLYSYDYFGEG